MTWYLDPDTGAVYNHTGSQVTTLQQPYSVPDDVFDVMYNEALSDFQNAGGLTTYSFRILVEAAFERIEFGNPTTGP